MLKKPTAKTVELPQQTNGKVLEHQHCEKVRGVYQTIHTSRLNAFTFSWIDSQHKELNTVYWQLHSLPADSFKELLEIIDRLGKARNELRLARFLFDVEEINPVHCLILRNKAVLAGGRILGKALQVWPRGSIRRNQKTQEDV